MSIVFAYYLRALSGDMLCMAKASVKCALIERVKAKNNSCPCCKQGNFDDFPNKGLQQPLYGFQVHCTNKEIDCQWTGELMDLLKGCKFTDINFSYCSVYVTRNKLLQHLRMSFVTSIHFDVSAATVMSLPTIEDVIQNHLQP